MIKLIVGNKGSGKTKNLIEEVNAAQEKTTGNIVCIEKGMKLTYDLNHEVRLIDAEEYNITGYDVFFGFVAGIAATNYDVKEIFVDGILKIGDHDLEGLGKLLDQVSSFSEKNQVNFVFTVSADAEKLPDSVKKYI